MLQPSPVPAAPLAERLRAGAGRRTIGIGLALLIEGLLLLALLSLGVVKEPGRKEERLTAVRIEANEVREEAAEPSSPEPERRAEEQPVPPQPAREEPPPPQPAEPQPAPIARPAIPTPPEPPPQLPRSTIRQPPPAARPVYGPPDTGGSPALRDSERVGTAPNGEPLYAAAWYREPTDAQMRAYLSTARGPGWGLIACKTAPDFRVEDCVALSEYPEGSQINRAVLAAAWEFKVRPPRLGGRSLVGSWVRIRIDYGIGRR